MRAPIDDQRRDLYRGPVVEVRPQATTSARSNTSGCYERQQVIEHAEATVGAAQTPPLCEKHL